MLNGFNDRDIERIKRLLAAYESGELTSRPRLDSQYQPPRQSVRFGKLEASVTAATTSGAPGSGQVSLYEISSTGGATDTTIDSTCYNISPVPVSSTSHYVLLHRDHASGRLIIDPPPHVVEIGKADSTISGASTSGTPASGTVSIYTLSTGGSLTDTGENVTAYNLSVDSVAADRWLQLVRHYRSGNWLVNYEDCGTTS